MPVLTLKVGQVCEERLPKQGVTNRQLNVALKDSLGKRLVCPIIVFSFSFQ